MIDFPTPHRPGLKVPRNGPWSRLGDCQDDGHGEGARGRQELLRADIRRPLGWEAPASNTAAFATGARLQDPAITATPAFARRETITAVAALALASFIAVAILSTVAYLFQRDGKPLERLAAAELAC